jgi:hypothetical protein
MNVWIVKNPHVIVIRTVKIYKEVSSAHARLATSLTLFFRPVLVRCSLVFIIYERRPQVCIKPAIRLITRN